MAFNTVGRTCGITSRVILVCLKALGLIHHVRPFQAECSAQVPYLTPYSVIEQSCGSMVVETRIKWQAVAGIEVGQDSSHVRAAADFSTLIILWRSIDDSFPQQLTSYSFHISKNVPWWRLLRTPHPVDLQVKIDITPSFSSVLISRGDAEIRSRVNEIFLVALFEISTFLCCHMIETPRRHHFWAL